jgi:hypothetical protein
VRPSRSVYVATLTLALGAALTIVDTFRNDECGEATSVLGWVGWALVVVGLLGSFITVTLDLRERRWLATVPGGVALLALLAAIGAAIVRTSLNSMCGFEIQL